VGNTLRRKLAIASWSSPKEGNIYGKVTVDATEALAYLEQVREETGERVTLTHLVGKAVAAALAEEPTLNGYIRLGRYVPHDEVAIAFLVSMEDGSDLAKAKVSGIDRKSITEVAAELRERAERLRTGTDDDWERSKGVVQLLPTWLLKPLVAFTGWLTAALGVEAKALGLEAFPFGSAVVTSVGMFGLDEGFAPPTPFARVPLYVLVGAVREQPTVVAGEVVVRPMLTVTATVDHRFIDGFQGAVLAQAFRRAFQDPWSLTPAPAGRDVDGSVADPA
jgi:pyruvate/2-oxoglutarate dehydrogenase complex dihydrolipoamide acyltransferase (E2) component